MCFGEHIKAFSLLLDFGIWLSQTLIHFYFLLVFNTYILLICPLNINSVSPATLLPISGIDLFHISLHVIA